MVFLELQRQRWSGLTEDSCMLVNGSGDHSQGPLCRGRAFLKS